MLYAWIVAVEKYGTGGAGAAPDGLDVQAPIGGWALDLAKVLLDRDAATKIVLNASLGPRAEYSERLEALQKRGVTPTGAARDDLENALASLEGKGTLLIYWVGHGIMDPERRYLLCADSRRAGDLRVLSVDSLSTHFRSARFPRTQMGFFDCCAQVVGNPNVLNLGGDGKTATEQFLYYAASAAQVAAADTTREGFSSTVIQALTASQAFPPVPKPFFRMLGDRLDALPLATRPVKLQWTEGSGESWSRQGGAATAELNEARRAKLGWSQFEHLWREAKLCTTADKLSIALRNREIPAFLDTLRKENPSAAAVDLVQDAWGRLAIELALEDKCVDLGLFWHDWLALYEQVCLLDLLGKADRLDDLPQLMLTVLDQANREKGWRSLIRLLELAARRAPNAKLLAAIKGHANLGPLYEDAVRKLPKDNDRLYLLLGLNYEPNAKTASLAKSSLFSGGKPDPTWSEDLPPGTLAEQINALIQRALEREQSLVVELLLPNDLLSAPRAMLEIVNEDLDTRTWIEAEYAVVVRWHDRMKDKEGKYHPGTWRAAAKDARARADQVAKLVCAWSGEGKLDCNVVGLSFPGPSPADPKRNRGAFFQELLRGAPYMCWPRETPADTGVFRKAVCDLIERNDVARLPDALRDAKRQDTEALTDLILLIDEPERNPYDLRFQDPAQRGNG